MRPSVSLDALAESAADIDRTFASAGSQLGVGLSLIAGHARNLAEMSSALADRRIEDARAALAAVAREMGETRTKFAAETATLMRLASHGREVGDLFEQLRRNMRVVTIVTRSARIEGSSVVQASSDFGDFTDEIVGLTAQASETVESCLRDQENLRVSLTATLAAQRDFERQFSASLSALSARILTALDQVSRAGDRNVELVGRVADRSSRVARASGDAIVAMQSGDNVRQRLEHVLGALRLDCSRQPAASAALLRSVQSAQLAATADILRQDCRRIDSALGLVAGEASGLVELVRSVFGGSEGSTILQELQRHLGEAAGLLRQCEAARQAVDDVVEQLAALLGRFETTVGRLTRTVADIVLIGINAGLKATRLGGAGRSLVIVAQQLKGTADAIAQDARQLKPVFARMVEASLSLRERGGQSERLARLDDDIAGALGVIREAGDRLAALLEQVDRETGRYLAEVQAARAAFSITARRGETLAALASELSRGVRGVGSRLDEATAARVRSFLLGELRARYSMAAEREIFDNVLREEGLIGQSPEPAAAEDAFILFA